MPFHFTLVQNIKRDPFEQAVGVRTRRRAMSLGGALGCAEHGVPLRLEHAAHRPAALAALVRDAAGVPPLQKPASYNLTQVMEQIKGTESSPGD